MTAQLWMLTDDAGGTWTMDRIAGISDTKEQVLDLAVSGGYPAVSAELVDPDTDPERHVDWTASSDGAGDKLSDQLREMLKDGNGFPPTLAAADVLVAVLYAVDRTDETWGSPGAPSVTDYALRIVDLLTKRYLTVKP